MKNLFDYATKELSQDAFLRWLFENWKEEEINLIVKKFLQEYCGICEEVTKIETFAQENYIDIKVKITTKSGKIINLFIEDKTFSSEHRQLSTYDGYINGLAEESYKVFYKTNLLSDVDKKGLKKANGENEKNSKPLWQSIDINDLFKIFDESNPYKNMILKDYVSYIKKIKDAVNNDEKPKSNNTNIDFLMWEAYFKNKIIQNLKQEQYWADAWKAGQYPYICLVVKKKGLGDNIPYLEVRSRDCLNNNFSARILCYGLKSEDYKDKQPQLIKNIEKLVEDEKSKFKKGKYVRKRKGKEINQKQVACTENLTIENDESFISIVEELTAEYLKVMENWN